MSLVSKPINVYELLPLRRGTTQIRILHLDPSTNNDNSDEVQGSLSVRSLDDRQNSFVALSYVWGSNADGINATINGKRMEITTNLDSALRHLRPRAAGRPIDIWVDAICINQHDEEEKSEQVGLMDAIYKNCSCVRVWLPNENSRPIATTTSFGTKVNLQVIFSYLSADHFHQIPGYFTDKRTGKLAFRETSEFLAMWEGFKLVADSAWWTRTWTAQEAFLPPQVQFFSGDAQPCDFKTLEKAEARFSLHRSNCGRPCCKHAISLFGRNKVDALEDFNRKVWNISFRRSFFKKHRIDVRDDFYIVVRAFAERCCREDRDKIYALWSFARKTCYRGFVLDYKKQTEEIFTDIFERMLDDARTNPITEACMDFRVLYGPGFGPDPRMPDKPSWVPDFSGYLSSEDSRIVMARLATFRVYRASGWQTGTVRVSGKELHLQGIRVDKISKIGEAVKTVRDSKHLQTIFHQWGDHIRGDFDISNVAQYNLELARLVCADVHHREASTYERLREEAGFYMREALHTKPIDLIREIIFQGMANREKWRRKRRKELLQGEAWNQFFQNGNMVGLENEHSWALAVALTGRALFVTEYRKMMGLCMPHAKKGDEIWVVYGAKLPFVLRPYLNLGFKGKAYYQLIGDCYLQGAMDGEFVKSSREVSEIVVV